MAKQNTPTSNSSCPTRRSPLWALEVLIAYPMLGTGLFTTLGISSTTGGKRWTRLLQHSLKVWHLARRGWLWFATQLPIAYIIPSWWWWSVETFVDPGPSSSPSLASWPHLDLRTILATPLPPTPSVRLVVASQLLPLRCTRTKASKSHKRGGGRSKA